MRIIQPKILEIPGAKFKMEIKRTSGKKSRKSGYRGCPLFWKFSEIAIKLRKIHVLGGPCSTRDSYSSPFNI